MAATLEKGHLPIQSPKRLLALVALLGIGGDIQLAESQAHLRSGLGFFLGTQDLSPVSLLSPSENVGTMLRTWRQEVKIKCSLNHFQVVWCLVATPLSGPQSSLSEMGTSRSLWGLPHSMQGLSDHQTKTEPQCQRPEPVSELEGALLYAPGN